MRIPSVTFAGLPSAELAAAGQIAVLGIEHATPYEVGKPSHSAGAPAALRAALTSYNLCLPFICLRGSRRAPQVLMMKPTNSRHADDPALGRPLDSTRLGCVFSQG